MKQILTILLAANLLLACNAGNEKEKTTTTAPAAETHADHGEQATELALNNGEKWEGRFNYPTERGFTAKNSFRYKTRKP